MRHDDRDGQPFIEGLVFALAALLAAILIFYTAKNHFQSGTVSALAARLGAGRAPAFRPGSATESAVAEVPPIRLAHVGSLGRRRVEVPAPAGPAAGK